MLPRSPRLRRILLAYTVNELGTWFGYVALALAVYEHTHSAIATAALFVTRGLLPALLAPVLVARTERSPRRGALAWLYLAEAALTVGLAALLWRFWLPGVLVLVAFDGIAAVAATALLRAAAARVAAEEIEEGASETGGPPSRAAIDRAQREANAALNFSFMAALAAGPALGGVLVHALGGPAALLVDAASFLVCSSLLVALESHVEDGAEASVRERLTAALRHIWDVPQLRVLLITEATAIVFFASIEPVEVIYAKSTLHAGALGYGLLLGVWGAGAALGAVVFARAVHRPLAPMLTGGTLLVGLAYLGFAAAPSLAVACCAAVVGGVGNGTQWPSLISAVQQLTPNELHGRLMSAIGSMNALCPAIGFAVGGAIVALSSPRSAMAVAGGVAAVATLAFLRLPLRGLQLDVTATPTAASTPDLAGATH